jgi:hypothetical protein
LSNEGRYLGVGNLEKLAVVHVVVVIRTLSGIIERRAGAVAGTVAARGLIRIIVIRNVRLATGLRIGLRVFVAVVRLPKRLLRLGRRPLLIELCIDGPRGAGGTVLERERTLKRNRQEYSKALGIRARSPDRSVRRSSMPPR